MEKQYQYNSVEEALEELRRGRIVLVTDDPDRENEGDMICAAEFATQENINFMACHAKGLICTPMSAALAGRLGLSQMVSENTDNHSTAFTVSVEKERNRRTFEDRGMYFRWWQGMEVCW